VNRAGIDGLGRVIVEASAAAILLVLLSPLLLAVAVAVRLSSPGPVLFRQQRLGADRRPFSLIKFRTMDVGNDDRAHREYVTALLTSGAPSHGGEEGIYKLAADPRITRVGAVLRRTSLDELPQLFNVLRGDMAFVGPRPVLGWEAELFPSWAAPRFDVRPGLTGLWQVRGRSTLSYSDALALDVAYCSDRSLRLDLWILLRTPLALLDRRAAR
jgi:lipopolysaccharide/colanic/teichoic acid biosynthesis glycosyltransferase